MSARAVAEKLVEAFIEGRPTDAILTEAPQEAMRPAITLARGTAEQVRHHAHRYAKAPSSSTWASIPPGMRPLVERYIKARRK